MELITDIARLDESSPTMLDHAEGDFFDNDNPRRRWYVAPVVQTRDSGPLDRANFDAALARLGGESDTCEVHRFGHWACGYYERIIVAPERLRELQAIAAALDDYPVLDEERFMAYEDTECNECWESMSLRERVELCVRAGESMFAARAPRMPCDCREFVLA